MLISTAKTDSDGVLVAVRDSSLPPADVASYGWRIAFLLGGLIGAVSYTLRRCLEESPEFLRMHAVATNPIRELLQQHGRAVLAAAGVAGLWHWHAVRISSGNAGLRYLPPSIH